MKKQAELEIKNQIHYVDCNFTLRIMIVNGDTARVMMNQPDLFEQEIDITDYLKMKTLVSLVNNFFSKESA